MASILCVFSDDTSQLYRYDLASLTDPDAEPAKIRYPVGWRTFWLLGSCRGRLCISQLGDKNVAIWNPVPGRNPKLFPPQDTVIRERFWVPCVRVHVFGYDDWKKEYVLLRVVQTGQMPYRSAVSILKFKEKLLESADSIYAWRRLPWIPYEYYLYDLSSVGVFVHGHLYWMMRREPVQHSAQVLMAFDIRTEEFVEVQLPRLNNRLEMHLAVLGEHLCLISVQTTRLLQPRFFKSGYVTESRVVNLWILKEYRLNGPWDRLLTIPVTRGSVWPLAYSQNGRRVLMKLSYDDLDDGLAWYDLDTKNVEQFHINGMPKSSATCLRL